MEELVERLNLDEEAVDELIGQVQDEEGNVDYAQLLELLQSLAVEAEAGGVRNCLNPLHLYPTSHRRTTGLAFHLIWSPPPATSRRLVLSLPRAATSVHYTTTQLRILRSSAFARTRYVALCGVARRAAVWCGAVWRAALLQCLATSLCYPTRC